MDKRKVLSDRAAVIDKVDIGQNLDPEVCYCLHRKLTAKFE